MLHLLSSIPQKNADWQRVESMLGAGDDVLFYDNAVTLLADTNVIPKLLVWLHEGISLYVLAEGETNKISVSNALMDKIMMVDWEGVVDLMVRVNGVQSL